MPHAVMIEEYTQVVKFLYEKLTEEDNIKLTKEDDDKLEKLKLKLASIPALSLPSLEKPFHLYVNVEKGVAHGVLVQEWGGVKRPVDYLSKMLDPVSHGWPVCIQAIATTAILVEESRKLTFGGQLIVCTPHAVRNVFNQKAEKWLTDSRMLKYEDILIDSDDLTLEVLLTTKAAIRTKERGWIHASRIKGPVEKPKEWTITSGPGDTKLALKRGLGGSDGDQLGIPVYEDLKRNKRELIRGFQTWEDEEWPPERILETYGPATWAQDGSWEYRTPIHMLNHIIRLQATVEIITNKTGQAMELISRQQTQTRAAVYQNRLALDYLLAEEGGVCGKFNTSDCCLKTDDNGDAILDVVNDIRKIAHVPVQKKQPYHVMHMRSHTDLPGAIVDGNKRADTLAMAAQSPALPDTFQQAKLSHQFYHQIVPALVRMFHLTREQAKAVKQTPKDHSEMRGSYRVTVMRMLLTLLMLLDIKAWKMGQPPENVWVTLAKTLRQDNLCLSMGSISSPLSLCLVGIPFKINEPSPLHPFAGNWPALPTAEKGPAREAWEQWVKLIPKATTDAHKENPVANSESQELYLLVSAKASYSFNFYFQNTASSYKNQSKPPKQNLQFGQLVQLYNKNSI
ncbi:hypothetical protein DUI87_32855 [Hirundo rustica rustica]|uniref:Reverse transcriptase/retrotransposon-derived protein RNase H-like domain-containing protein n=1 Tax=Hirundo rustica rustica TaxID=333673 RepID=A0A3M0IQW3_HIRRU|nr:hypothetical protein DUI87_32855 [Hirundo rustica rustica]